MSPEAGFLLHEQIVHRLRAVIPRSVLYVGSEDHEELVADATCVAARIMHNGEQKGKRVPHSGAAYYAIQHCKSGRKSVGHSSSDVHGSACQLQGHSRLESMEQVVAVNEESGGEILELHDVLANDHEDVALAVGRKLDWEDFCADPPARERAVIQFLIEGKSDSCIARKLKTPESKIQSIKKHLARAIIRFMGPDSIERLDLYVAEMRWDAAMCALQPDTTLGGHLRQWTRLKIDNVTAIRTFLARFPILHVDVGNQLPIQQH